MTRKQAHKIRDEIWFRTTQNLRLIKKKKKKKRMEKERNSTFMSRRGKCTQVYLKTSKGII